MFVQLNILVPVDSKDGPDHITGTTCKTDISDLRWPEIDYSRRRSSSALGTRPCLDVRLL